MFSYQLFLTFRRSKVIETYSLKKTLFITLVNMNGPEPYLDYFPLMTLEEFEYQYDLPSKRSGVKFTLFCVAPRLLKMLQ